MIEGKAGGQFRNDVTADRAFVGRKKKSKDVQSSKRILSERAPEKYALDASLRQPSDQINSIGKIENASLEKRLQLEELISELSARFIHLPADLIDKDLKEGQQRVCEALGLHRSSFLKFSEDYEKIFVTHTWHTQGITGWNPSVLTSDYEYTINMLRCGSVIVFSDPEELPEEAQAERSIVKELGIKSELVIPLKVGANILGAMTWESFVRYDWPKELVGRLRLVSEIFANALSRKGAEMLLRESIQEIRKLKDELKVENRYLLDEIRVRNHKHGIIGRSDSIKKIFTQVGKVAYTSSTVLIMGETGTGKEMVANAIHDMSPRKDRAMVRVNCSALPATLIESELFGHEKGAFSGAVSKRVGRFELANGSTIFLDEISELHLELQSKLLRVLQEGQFERLGSAQTINTDMRVIAATNQDLARAVRDGRFRKDLYYRLNIFPITMPPLRERKEDIPLLVKAFVNEFSGPLRKRMEAVSDESLKALESHSWPGNIRELRNLVERAMIVSRGRTLHIKLPDTDEFGSPTLDTMDDMQRKYILWVLEKVGWRIFGEKGAARVLGMNPSTLQSRMKRLGISRERRFH